MFYNFLSENKYKQISIELFKELYEIKERVSKIKNFEWVAFSDFDGYLYKFGGVILKSQSPIKKKYIGDIFLASNMAQNYEDGTIDIYVDKAKHKPIKIKSFNLKEETNNKYKNLKLELNRILNEFIDLEEAGLLYKNFPEKYVGDSYYKIIFDNLILKLKRFFIFALIYLLFLILAGIYVFASIKITFDFRILSLIPGLNETLGFVLIILFWFGPPFYLLLKFLKKGNIEKMFNFIKKNKDS